MKISDIKKRITTTLTDHWEVSLDEMRMASFWRDAVGELVASFYLMSIQCCIALGWKKDEVKGSTLENNLCIGGAIFVLIEAFGQFGGAHMNPAVSIAFVVDGRMTFFRALIYIPIQLLGVSAGAGLIYYVTPPAYREALSGTNIHPEMTAGQGVIMEAWLTAFLLMTIYGSMNEARRPVYMNSLVVGFWVFVASCAGDQYCGASMNPARSFGPAIVMNRWQNHWIYWVGPICGALLGTLLFSQFFNRIGESALTGRRKLNVRSGNVGLMQTSSVSSALSAFSKSLVALGAVTSMSGKRNARKPAGSKTSNSTFNDSTWKRGSGDPLTQNEPQASLPAIESGDKQTSEYL